jgi:DNA helicase HerA-like ATPase
MEDIGELSKRLGTHFNSLQALYRKLVRFKRLPFIVPSREDAEDTINKIIHYLERGINVVLEFGRQNSVLAYLLVANIISRRIHETWVEKTEHYQATKNPADKPRQLMITIEEAHKFLNRETAKQTIFGTIARELRKYYVTLLIVDQRPSGIDDEVMSQIGTRISALLNDERDIQAVFTGVPNSSGLRSILASLDSKQQALLLGHAVPMPITIKVRDYDEAFYKAMSSLEASPENLDKMKKLIFD